MTTDQFNAWLSDPARRPLVMGVLNVTPDSFSDGGQYAALDGALAHAEEMAAAGADLIDVGGETTKPGSQPVPATEQIRRIEPVIAAVAGKLPVVVSIDTTRGVVAEAAINAGAFIVNDISAGLDDPAMFPLAQRWGVPIILMHMLGRPATMQVDPTYKDVTVEVAAFLQQRLAAALACGIDRSKIMLDPGIGFGKTDAHNLELLRRLKELAALGQPLVLGVSRKRFIGAVTGETVPAHRVFGTAAAVAWCLTNGAAVVRVHDVAPMVQVTRLIRAIQTGPSGAMNLR